MSSIYFHARAGEHEQLADFQRAFFPHDQLLHKTRDGLQITLDDLRAEYLHEQLALLAARPGFVNFERWQRRLQEEREFQERQTTMFRDEGPE